MVEAAREGKFVPEARHDILAEVIGTEEHGRRVCGVKEGVGLRLFFGYQRKSTKSSELNAHKQNIESFEKKLEEQKRMLKRRGKKGRKIWKGFKIYIRYVLYLRF